MLAAALPIVLGVLGIPEADVQVETRCEVRGGEAPVIPGQAAEAQLGSVLEPDGALLLRTPTTVARLHYLPRFTLRHPNPDGRLRPLLLHTLGARLDAHASRTVDWNADVEASMGDVDYLGLIQLLPDQTAIPVVSRYFNAVVGVGGALQATRRWRLEG